MYGYSRRTETEPPPPTAEQFLLGGKREKKKRRKIPKRGEGDVLGFWVAQ